MTHVLTELSPVLWFSQEKAPEQEAGQQKVAEVGFSFVLEVALTLNICFFQLASLAWQEVEATDDCFFLHTAASLRTYT